MTDTPDPGHNISPLNAQRMREFFSLYGSFLQLWQTFELVIEISIMRQLNLSARHASIVLSSLNFSAKSNILLAVLKEEAQNNQEAISAIGNVQSKAGRNDYIHSFLTTSDVGTMRLVRRNIKNGNYTASLLDVDATMMGNHAYEFSQAFERASKALGVNDADVDQYAKEIESHA